MVNLLDFLLRVTETILDLREGTVLGKLDMQKTFYFAKELGLPVPFTFRWGKLGPFSYELSNILERLRSQGFISYDGKYKRGKPLSSVDSLEVPHEVRSFFDELNDIRDEKKYNPIYFIECLGSIHFLYKYSGLKDKEKIFERLRLLMEPAWDFLKRHGLII